MVVNLTGSVPVVVAMGQLSPGGGRGAGVDDEALRHLYQVHASDLLPYLIRLSGGDRHRAEDILQETLVRAWSHPEARGPDGRWTRAWLFTVARRIAIDHLRVIRARPTELPAERIEAYGVGGDEIERVLDAAEVRAALASLPERFRHTLIEIYFREHSIAEAARNLAVPPGTVKSRTFYALQALREALAARGFTFDPAESP
jgi:RNA polymerase sigma-70 factor (ECF subfamily)